MEFKKFMAAITGIASQQKIVPKFRHDKEHGIYIAYFPNNIRMTGNSLSKKITVKWGNSHCSEFEIV